MQTSQQAANASNDICELPRLLAEALPWVLHSLQARTGNPSFPVSFIEWLAMSCVAAAMTCGEAVTGELKLDCI